MPRNLQPALEVITLDDRLAVAAQREGFALVDGRRRSKTIGATTTRFLYDGFNAVHELVGRRSGVYRHRNVSGLLKGITNSGADG